MAYRATQIALTGTNGYYYIAREGSILGQFRFTDRYFDLIEAVHERATFLLDQHIANYSEEACLSLYAAVGNAEKHIAKTENNAIKFVLMRKWYSEAYAVLMKRRSTGVKQKVRLVLLRYAPYIHSLLF